jgi:hypothetical protein
MFEGQSTTRDLALPVRRDASKPGDTEDEATKAVVMMVLGIVLLVAGYVGVTGRGATDSRDPEYSLAGARTHR